MTEERRLSADSQGASTAPGQALENGENTDTGSDSSGSTNSAAVLSPDNSGSSTLERLNRVGVPRSPFSPLCVSLTIVCSKCGVCDTISVPLSKIAKYAFRGRIHDALDQIVTGSEDSNESNVSGNGNSNSSLRDLKNLLETRLEGWNDYAETKCGEACAAGYGKCKQNCEGIIHVTAPGMIKPS